METTHTTIVLEIDEMADCPSGRAHLQGGPSREFHGWLGLTEVIDVLARTLVDNGPMATTNGEETP